MVNSIHYFGMFQLLKQIKHQDAVFLQPQLRRLVSSSASLAAASLAFSKELASASA